jgi:hypothetical protein
MVLGGDHGGRGGGRGHQQSRGAGGYASGHQQHGGAGGFVASQGQGSSFGWGGNQPMFHLGYGGGDRSLMHRGGCRGRHNFWHGGRGTSTEGQIIGDRAAQNQIRDGGSHGRSVLGGAVSTCAAGKRQGALVSSLVVPDVSKAVDLLHQAFAATNGSGSVANHVLDSTWDQIVSLLQLPDGRSNASASTRWDAVGSNLGLHRS